MSEIKDVYNALNSGTLSNAMKKGFAKAIESLDTYLLAKYKKTVIDIANLVHPNPKNSPAYVTDENGEKVNVLTALMNGITITADTWEAAQSEAGQEVAKAVKEGKLSKEKAAQVLNEAKAENWNTLLKDGKLGILAALRNIRNIVNNPASNSETITMLCNLLEDGKKIREGLIMPYQIDVAYETVRSECHGSDARLVLKALQNGYMQSVPNLAKALPGKTAVLVDCSGSMNTTCYTKNGRIQATAAEKAGLLAATIAKATNADVVRFGSYAHHVDYDPNQNVFDMGRMIGSANEGGTNIGAAFNALSKKYDRVILLSDNEANYGNSTSNAYKAYIRRTGANPYVYCIDLACYGTTPLKNDGRVNYYFGYGYAMFDDIASKEFNPAMHIDKVRKIVI
jgi:polyhydroxyalkanoate synthesis regulator phasin